MRYLRWTREHGELGEGLVEEWTEVADDGHVVREVGFDASGRVAHKMPSKTYKHGRYGLFDLAVIALDGKVDDVSPELFEQYWREGKD